MIRGMTLEWVASPLGLIGLPLRWLRSARHDARTGEDHAARDRRLTRERMLYHLGRGRRAREAGRFEDGAREARKALLVNPQSAWALALLGQCLTHQHQPELHQARQVLERAQALEPMNGYFVRLLLEVLEAAGDQQARADVLAWAWWHGAPVDRWLPDGPPTPRSETGARDAALCDGAPAAPATRDPVMAGR
jgi:tetratricopeptide (TPR) repeat protein